MNTPLANYDIEANEVKYDSIPEVVWAGILDKRFKIEVTRTEAYAGTLCIYDAQQADKLIHSEPTSLAFGAVFGPDAGDVYTWQEKACEVVDKLTASQ